MSEGIPYGYLTIVFYSDALRHRRGAFLYDG